MARITIDNRNRIIFYGSPAGYLQENKAVVDPMFQNNELENWLTVRNSFEVEWQQGVFEKLSSASWVQSENAPPLKNIRIWQLKPESDIMMKFIGYDEMMDRFGEPSPENYNMVFDGDVGTNDLEAIYEKFNIDHPTDFKGHSLSISDVVELYDANGSEFHYVDHYGFKQISFGEESQDMSMEMQL